VGQLLTLMDGLNANTTEKRNNSNRRFVTVIATTTSPNVLDPALRRPGRYIEYAMMIDSYYNDADDIISIGSIRRLKSGLQTSSRERCC